MPKLIAIASVAAFEAVQHGADLVITAAAVVLALGVIWGAGRKVRDFLRRVDESLVVLAHLPGWKATVDERLDAVEASSGQAANELAALTRELGVSVRRRARTV